MFNAFSTSGSGKNPGEHGLKKYSGQQGERISTNILAWFGRREKFQKLTASDVVTTMLLFVLTPSLLVKILSLLRNVLASTRHNMLFV